ncbi:MAG: hypothetical protein R3253_02970 [Longimicrobiales bacterium]|nr:hypothetical protein [Longimicrobiales bacterium]
MPKNDSRRGATNLGTPLMIVAFVVIGGFMYWLSEQAAAEREMQAIEETPVEDTTPSVRVVAPGDIQMDASPFLGEEIRINATNVASLLGQQGFWLATPSGNPFLVSKGPEVMASGVTITSGSPVTVIGTVREMNDSTLTAWTEAGTIAEGDRVVAEFATHYIEASDVMTPQGQRPGGSGGQGSGGQGAGNDEGADEGSDGSGS